MSEPRAGERSQLLLCRIAGLRGLGAGSATHDQCGHMHCAKTQCQGGQPTSEAPEKQPENKKEREADHCAVSVEAIAPAFLSKGAHAVIAAPELSRSHRSYRWGCPLSGAPASACGPIFLSLKGQAAASDGDIAGSERGGERSVRGRAVHQD